MRWIRITVIALLVLVVGSLLYYALPQRDVVRIVNTDVRRMDFGWNAVFYAAADGSGQNRDIRFIEAVDPGGNPMVYRNEDTGWGWPPFLKFDSADLQAEAADLVSTREAPVWVAVRHYGWRSRLLSAFPNATSIRRVDGPDVTFFPWLNIVILVLLLAALLAVWRVVQLFVRNTIRPLFRGRG